MPKKALIRSHPVDPAIARDARDCAKRASQQLSQTLWPWHKLQHQHCVAHGQLYFELFLLDPSPGQRGKGPIHKAHCRQPLELTGMPRGYQMQKSIPTIPDQVSLE